MAAKPAVGRPGGLLAAPASRQRALVSRPRPRAPGRVAAAPEAAETAAVASPLIIPFEPHAAPRAEAPPGAPPLVILPGFGNAARDYEAPFGDAEAGLAAALRRRGWAASALPLRRKDWLRVAAMLARPDYWRGGCDAFAGYKFYLDAVAAEVARVQAATGAERVVLVAHSAGGWLARAFIGDARCRLGVEGAAAARPGWAASLASLWDGLTDSDAEASASAAEDEAATGPHPAVAALVTLGAPHAPPPPGSGARDVTGGAQGWVNARWPGAHFAGRGVEYIAVAGRSVIGDSAAPRGAPPKYAHAAYFEVSGAGDGVAGDGVVPLASALLAGARHVVVDGARHSVSRLGSFEEAPPEGAGAWYGSEEVVDLWLGELAAALRGEQ